MSDSLKELTTEFNVDPYWDDYDENDNYYRILFNPARAVQSRELTQSQTITQQQVTRIGKHLFKDGTITEGGEFNVELGVPAIRIKDKDVFNNDIDINDLNGAIITGQTTGVQAIVQTVSDGTQTSSNPKTLYVKYIVAGEDTAVFSPTETFESTVGITFASIDSRPILRGSLFKINKGVVFAKGLFLNFEEQTVLLGRYTAVPTCRVGFKVNESIVTELQDQNLLDPAQGSSNHTAPGAHRLKVSCVLTSIDYVNTDVDDFIELVVFNYGVIEVLNNKTEYAKLSEELARRTFEESGNYIVNGLGAGVREHLNNGNNNGVYSANAGGNTNLLVATVDAGKAYINGYEIENIITKYIPFEKSTAYKTVEQQTIPANYGNYIAVNELVGHININTGTLVRLYNTAQKKNSKAIGATASMTGSQIGTARLVAVVLDDGNAGSYDAVYNVYINDIKMTSGAFTDVKAIYSTDSTNVNLAADVILVNGKAVLQETSFNRQIYNLSTNNIRSIRDENNEVDLTYTASRSFNVSVSTTGTFSIDTGSDSEIFPATGVLNASQKKEIFLVQLNNAVTYPTAISGTVTVNANSATLTGTSTQFLNELRTGDKLLIASSSEVVVVKTVNSNTSITLVNPAVNAASGSVANIRFMAGDYYDLSRFSASVDVTAPRLAQFNLGFNIGSSTTGSVLAKVNLLDAREKKKILKPECYAIIQCNTHPNGRNGPWNLGIPDAYKLLEVRRLTSGSFTNNTQGSVVTKHFTMDSGQTDTLYDFGLLKKGSTFTPSTNDLLLVKFSAFQHDLSQGVGFFSVDSYPIDDANTANTTAIRTEQIPVYTSKTTGASYDLRNAIDSRPSRNPSASYTTTISSVTVNPANTSTALNTVNSRLYTPYPNEPFIADMSYYLARRDLVVIDKNGSFRVITGNPSISPTTPAESSDSMVLAKLFIPPYPSLAPSAAIVAGRSDLGAEITTIDNSRFTMKDIGVLKKRIETLEYYTSLNTLEIATKDMKILDADGLDRFKNGILVDPFTGHGIANVFDIDYSAAIDRQRNELRPKAKINQFNLDYNPTKSSNVQLRQREGYLILVANVANFVVGERVYQGSTLANSTASATITHKFGNVIYFDYLNGTFVNGSAVKGSTSNATGSISSSYQPKEGNLVSLPYDSVTLISQPRASGTRNPAGLFWFWKGDLELSPNIDVWAERNQLPDLKINLEGNLDAFKAITNAMEIDWNSWKTTWTGTQVIDSQTSSSTTTTSNNTATTATTTNTVTNTNLNTTVQTATGTKLVAGATTITQSFGNRVIDVSIVPFMRSRRINVVGTGLKPNAVMYAFFDDIDVNDYCRPCTSSWVATGGLGGKLKVNSDGELYFQFILPNNDNVKFSVGTKILRVTDSASNSSVQGTETTSAEGQYTSSGVHQTTQKTIVSTQKVNVKSTQVSKTQTSTSTSTSTSTNTSTVVTPLPVTPVDPVVTPPVVRPPTPQPDEDEVEVVDNDGTRRFVRMNDPLAQSFLVSVPDNTATGCFLTKVGAYFRTKHSKYGVSAYIVEMENGFPTQRMVPYSLVKLKSSQVNISEDSSRITWFFFSTPVYLQNNTEYALIILPEASNPDYNVWTAKLGQKDILTPSIKITQQPYSGVLFVSSNASTWNAVQDEDLKFEINCARFTSTTGAAYFRQQKLDMMLVTNVSGEFDLKDEEVRGEYTITLSNLSGDAPVVGNQVYGETSAILGGITNVSGSKIRVNVSNPTAIYTKNEDLTFRQDGVATGTTAKASAIVFPTGIIRKYNNDDSENVKMTVEVTSTNKFATNEFVRGMETNALARITGFEDVQVNLVDVEFNTLQFLTTGLSWTSKTLAADDTFKTAYQNFINLGENTPYTDIEYKVTSYSKETTSSGEGTFNLRAYLTTTNQYQSPVIDTSTGSAIFVGNIINNIADTNTSEESVNGGDALARYITRPVTLADGQDAEDLVVYATLYRPPGSDINVYYKILNSEDSDTLDDISWVKMTKSGNSNAAISDKDNTDDYKEIQYVVPSAKLTGSNAEVQYTNSQGVTFTGYKSFMIKIVMSGTNTSIVPRVKNFRAICLQK